MNDSESVNDGEGLKLKKTSNLKVVFRTKLVLFGLVFILPKLEGLIVNVQGLDTTIHQLDSESTQLLSVHLYTTRHDKRLDYEREKRSTSMESIFCRLLSLSHSLLNSVATVACDTLDRWRRGQWDDWGHI